MLRPRAARGDKGTDMILAFLDSDRLTPLLLAAVLAWILCVCLHEFAHALVAWFGGDQSVRDKGYLSLDFTRYLDPFSSVLLPVIVLALGGVPLPGGAVMIDESALKSRRWGLYVSAAGPGANLLVFLALGLLLHPSLGLIDPYTAEQPTWVYFLGAMAFLNFIAALFNLLPVPPLDGYRLIEHQLPEEWQWRLRQPQAAMTAFALLFLILWTVDQAWYPFYFMFGLVTDTLGLPAGLMIDGYDLVLFNQSPGS